MFRPTCVQAAHDNVNTSKSYSPGHSQSETSYERGYGHLKCSLTWKLYNIYLFIIYSFIYVLGTGCTVQFTQRSKWRQSAWLQILTRSATEIVTLRNAASLMRHAAPNIR
jgi:hypothetical protein